MNVNTVNYYIKKKKKDKNTLHLEPVRCSEGNRSQHKQPQLDVAWGGDGRRPAKGTVVGSVELGGALPPGRNTHS